MRFHKPDNLSPFGQGGYNAYAYCNCNPINFRDDTGHARTFAQLRKFWAENSQPPPPSTTQLKRAPKKKVTFDRKITSVIYTDEHDIQRSRLIKEKQSLQDYIQKFTQRVRRKTKEFNFLMEPSTSVFAKSLGISAKRYQTELEELATWLDEAHDRLKYLNVTLRSYRV
ncbi:hypothetical protein C4Q28_02790 [Pseudomonas sp. SWI6]|uniref:RHS repeat-associated core domain-containing protein n=1 Tax=unclassified Pseudomonas TaxID=196821 RepID=UPI000CE5E8CB|nr:MULTISPECIES: RHS repeat-associated core domain-containing protein [unclassified Pseudomonas]AVD81161.1 hypothetical protein C4Q28_02790 [Pseudomonas sp. SWI6]